MKVRQYVVLIALAFGLACASTCGGSPSAPVTNVLTGPTAANAAEVAYLVGAGDIGYCGSTDAALTADLVDQLPGTVITVGDNAYQQGTASEFAQCYEPTWGRFKSRTRPSPGNHDYLTPGAAGYFDYFGSSAGIERTGYYSFNAGSWHILSLNSSTLAKKGSAQWAWVQADLTQNHQPCTLAYWHYPVFSSGFDGNIPQMADIWQLLSEYGADVVISAHAHDYERFSPMDAFGRSDPRGIREFVVGTGGATLTGLVARQPNSEVFDNSHFGVIYLTLRPDGYDWRFIPKDEGAFMDMGSGSCH